MRISKPTLLGDRSTRQPTPDEFEEAILAGSLDLGNTVVGGVISKKSIPYL